MKKAVARAEFNDSKKKSEKLSWQVEAEDIVPADRQTRASKPEIIYSLDKEDSVQVDTEVTFGNTKTAHVLQTVNDRQTDETVTTGDDNDQTEPVLQQPIVDVAAGAAQNYPLPVWQDAETGSGDELDNDNVQPGVEAQQQDQAQVVVPEQQQDDGQVVQDAQQDEQDEDDDDVFVSDSDEDSNDEHDMAEDRTLMPGMFSGGTNNDADDWLRKFNSYRTYKAYNDVKSLSLFKALLDGGAGIWLESLPDEKTRDLTTLLKEFEERYKSPEILRYKNAREIFARILHHVLCSGRPSSLR